MRIPQNITREDVLKAIDEIDKNGIPSHRESTKYYLLFKDKKYPPKYVISIANKYENGEELESTAFFPIEASEYLKNLGFVVEKKSKDIFNGVNCWIEKTIVKGREDRQSGSRSLGKALWSPIKDKRGADLYKNMREVKKDDIVLHLVDNKEIVGVSKIAEEAVEADGIKGTPWEGPAYLIKLKDFIKLNPPIKRDDLLNDRYKQELLEITDEGETFYTRNLSLRQGAYLTPCNRNLFLLINNIYRKNSGQNLPYFEDMNIDEIIPKGENIIVETFLKSVISSGLFYRQSLISRLIGSLITKPFVILTGLTGSGKTKLAQAFARWICEDDSQYTIVPVGADWTDREPLLGFSSALDPNEYIIPENGALRLLAEANKSGNRNKPYFLILDEMNLSHVERYFADFLSVMESGEAFRLHDGDKEKSGIPPALAWPPNLFVIGTVNIDETTYMFSPKVLDRANVIEFRVEEKDIGEFLDSSADVNLDSLTGQGSGLAGDFLAMVQENNMDSDVSGQIAVTLKEFFRELKKVGAEFGYRTAIEIRRLYYYLTLLDQDLSDNEKTDIVIMQKLLPRLHGSRRKLLPVLEKLAGLCAEGLDVKKDLLEKSEETLSDGGEGVKYPMSLAKIVRMYKGAVENGYASYAEA